MAQNRFQKILCLLLSLTPIAAIAQEPVLDPDELRAAFSMDLVEQDGKDRVQFSAPELDVTALITAKDPKEAALRMHNVFYEAIPLEPVKLEASAGASAQTETGLGLTAAASTDLPLGKQKFKGYLIPDLRLKISGSALVGSDLVDKPLTLPAFSAQAGIKFTNPPYLLNPMNRALLGPSKQTSGAEIAVDRNIAMDRAWRAHLNLGTDSIFGDPQNIVHPSYLAVTPLARIGAGSSGDAAAIPFGVLGAKVQGKSCPWISQDRKNAFCLDGSVIALGGAVQVGGEMQAGAYYRQTIDQSPSAAIHSVSIGAQGSGEALFDLAGAHAAASGGGIIKIE